MVDGRGAQLVATMHQIHLVANTGKVDDVGCGRVAASYHHHVFIAEEVAIAGGAVGDAATAQLLFVGQPQLSCHRARGHDNRAGEIGAKGGGQLVGLGGKVHRGDVFHNESGAERAGLLVHVPGQLEAAGGARVAGIVLQMLRLRALAARGEALENGANEPSA